MAWENANMPVNTHTISDATYLQTMPNLSNSSKPSYLTTNFLPSSLFSVSDSFWILGDEQAGLKAYRYINSGNNLPYFRFQLYYGGAFYSGTYEQPQKYLYGNEKRFDIGIVCGINEETGKGTIYLVNLYSVNSGYYSALLGENDTTTCLIIRATMEIPSITSNGGGATHIAKVTGQLKDLSASNILLVSGGGGGGLLLGDSGWHGTEEDLIWSGNNNKMTVLKDGNDIKFKFYTNGTAIYTVTSQLADVSKIYVSFLADDENQVMKPSFIYETASGVYSYNQEEPTDEQMGDLYTWLSAGLTSN